MVRRVEVVMGTVVGVDVRDAIPADAIEPAFEAFFATLRDIDDRFSPYRPESEISRIADGRLAEADASADVRFVLACCDHLAASSGGAFDARRHRADGRLDPSGFVKGWAIDEALRHLDEAGLRCYAVNAGGDVVLRGNPQPDRGWLVGIRHPTEPDRIAARLEIHGGAVATSALYERAGHIRDPRTGAVPDQLVSLTVVGPELTWADAYATTAFTIGADGPAWVERHPGYGAIAITADERLEWSPTAAPLLSRGSQEVAVS
ncbi:MAG TPA: FAD:protein FMN transferase [Candidatus Limnocylindrales bacterium]|nr:FAD:protein FMN transferase [Candidatus Limnocylindrales bacterium]